MSSWGEAFSGAIDAIIANLPAILGAATTLVCLFIFGAQYFIIPSMAFIAVELVIFRKRFEKSHSDGEEKDAEVSENG